MAERPWPTRLAFRRAEKALHIAFESGEAYAIPFELLRVESPSAEVQGHAPHQKQIITGKADVQVDEAEPVGRYAVRLKFSDGHSSGIFSWDYLHELGANADRLMAEHRKAAGA
ncbi:gamma-butyrobetaine hydroxylase-like domain-containing protein [Maricaulaceae bacterium MS644]